MSSIKTKTLDTSKDGLLAVGDQSLGYGYISIPRAGLNNFLEIQMEIHKFLPDPLIEKEAAKIIVDNRSGSPAVGDEVKELLSAYGYRVTELKTGATEPKNKIIDYSNGNKSYALTLLPKRFKTTVTKEKAENGITADIVVVVGKEYTPKLKTIKKSSNESSTSSSSKKQSERSS